MIGLRFLLCLSVLEGFHFRAYVQAVHLEGQRHNLEGIDDLQPLLNWAIEHSDSEILRKMASTEQKAASTLQEKQERVRSLLEEMSTWPTETELIVRGLEAARNASLTQNQRATALLGLQDILDQIDRANDLPRLGALPVLVDALSGGGPLQVAALKVIATASSNNVAFQKAFLAHEAAFIPWLLQLIADNVGSREHAEVVAAATLALASMSTNLDPSQTSILSAVVPGIPPKTAHDQCAPSLRLLLRIASSTLACTQSKEALKDQRRNCRLALLRSIGLLTDLIANFDSVRDELAACPTAAASWADICERSLHDLDEGLSKALDLLVTLVNRKPPAADAFTDNWKCVIPCLEQLTLSSNDVNVEDGNDGQDIRRRARSVSMALRSQTSLPQNDEL